MPVDPSVFNNIKTYQDYKNQQDAVDLQRAQVGAALQGASIDTLTKKNVLKGQYLSAAAGTGDQATWDATRQKLGGLGIDVSDVPHDVATGTQYANALKISQSPYGALINGGKAISDMTGTIPPVLSGLIGGNTIPPKPVVATTSQSTQAPAQPVTANSNTGVDPSIALNASDVADNPNIASTLTRAITPANGVINPATANGISLQGANPNAASAPTAASLPPKAPNETLDAYKLRLSNDPNVIAAQEQAKQQGQIDAKRGSQALETSDMTGLFNKVAKTASTFNGGALGSITDAVTNAANVSTNSNINRAGFKADVSNLAMAMFRNMSATGRVTRAEGNYILQALPNDKDSNGVMIETANNHNQFYNDWMVKRGFDPVSGQKLQPGQQPNLVPQVDNPFKDAVKADSQPALADFKVGTTKTSPTGTYLQVGQDPADPKSWKKIKWPQ